MSARPYQALVEVLRGDVVESIHYALIVVVRPDGEIVQQFGDPELPIVSRSAGKPFQAAAFVESGAAHALGVAAEELAIAVGSHGGAPEHTRVVQRLLARAGVSSDALLCGIHPPFDKTARVAGARTGYNVLQNNCSGKHAAMVCACRHHRYDESSYLDPDHPWQQHIAHQLARYAGTSRASLTTVTDGCSAPSFVLPARRLAQAYAQWIAGSEPALREVAQAALAHPILIAGQDRLETEVMELLPGRVLLKNGAEGVMAISALVDREPLGALVKIADGDDRRARSTLVIELLAQLFPNAPIDWTPLRDRHIPAITSWHGEVIGSMRARLN